MINMSPSELFLVKERAIKKVAEGVNKFLGVNKKPLINGRKYCIIQSTVNGCRYWVQIDDGRIVLNGLKDNAHKFPTRTQAESAISTYPNKKRYNFEIKPI